MCSECLCIGVLWSTTSKKSEPMCNGKVKYMPQETMRKKASKEPNTKDVDHALFP